MNTIENVSEVALGNNNNATQKKKKNKKDDYKLREDYIGDNEPHKNWAFTLNNYTEEDIERWKRYTYTICYVGKEVGELGTPHLQGWVTWKRGYRFGQLAKLEPRCNWGRGKMSDGENYCNKDGSDMVIIVRPKQGHRSDWHMVKNMINEGATKSEIAEEYPGLVIRHSRGIENLGNWLEDKRQLKKKKVEFYKKEVVWIWGPTGVGKSKYVFDVTAEKDVWKCSKTLDWFDGYYGQEVVWIDDFRNNKCTFDWLLSLTDGYSLTVPIKGGFVDWNPKTIYFTSCMPPGECYNKETFGNHEKVSQLLRRVTKVIFMAQASSSTNDFFNELVRSPCL